MPKMSAKVREHGTPKQDNSPAAMRAKIDIRRRVLESLGADAAVLDCFAGAGEMFEAIWRTAGSYVGCDERFFPEDERFVYAVDNRRLLRTLDLARFNIFDLDAYGGPWEQVWIIAHRRRLAAGERIGLVLTEGQAMKMNMGGMSKSLSLISGVPSSMPGMGSAIEQIIDRAIKRTAAMMGADIERRWQATGKTGSAMRYIGLILAGAA